MHRSEAVRRALVEAARQRRGAIAAAGCAVAMVIVVPDLPARVPLQQDQVPSDDAAGAEALHAVARGRVPQVALRRGGYVSLTAFCIEGRHTTRLLT